MCGDVENINLLGMLEKQDHRLTIKVLTRYVVDFPYVALHHLSSDAEERLQRLFSHEELLINSESSLVRRQSLPTIQNLQHVVGSRNSASAHFPFPSEGATK